MEVYIPQDIENELRVALAAHISEAVYCKPLPKNPNLPCIEITATGGSESSTIDTWTVILDSRAKDEADAFELLRRCVGLVRAIAKKGNTPIRFVEVNTLGSWAADSSRPDLAMCSATLRVIAHETKTTI